MASDTLTKPGPIVQSYPVSAPTLPIYATVGLRPWLQRPGLTYQRPTETKVARPHVRRLY